MNPNSHWGLNQPPPLPPWEPTIEGTRGRASKSTINPRSQDSVFICTKIVRIICTVQHIYEISTILILGANVSSLSISDFPSDCCWHGEQSFLLLPSPCSRWRKLSRSKSQQLKLLRRQYFS